MAVIDLTRDFVLEFGEPVAVGRQERRLESGNTTYTGVLYDFGFPSMTGSYIDFPGHIAETDDGRRADNVAVEEFFRLPAQVIHLDRADNSGAVGAAELEAASGGAAGLPALILNALGRRNPHDTDWRGVYLGMDAVEWIIASGCRVLLSDIYESKNLEGVFLRLFAAGICAVCEPVDLARLRADRAELTVLFPRYPGVTQAPCRIVAEFPEAAPPERK